MRPSRSSTGWSSLPADTGPADLIRLGKIRRRIEHDYRELKTGLGLDHFEGCSWTGWNRRVTRLARRVMERVFYGD